MPSLTECYWFPSEYQNDIGVETCNELWDACDNLYDQAHMRLLNLSRLKDALKNPNFATIRRIHTELKACEPTANCVPNFLMERYLRHHGSWLLALIVALDEPVSTDFAKVSVECLGYAFQLPPIIKRVGVSSPPFFS
jgi:hypothetical protein